MALDCLVANVSNAHYPLFDAHNHLQDERLATVLEQALRESQSEHIERMVVNGSSERDWPAVLELARRLPQVIPSFGYHPWYIKERSHGWRETLLKYLDNTPCGVGEIGLDHWIKERNDAEQEEVFITQLRIAAERNLPVSIHCLQAWGRLLEIFQAEPLPRCGFVLHSFGGPKEMIPALARLGAYFSLPGYFALERKTRQREAFTHVPVERLLIETDAPDQLLPEERERYSLREAATGKRLNHPGNLRAVYEFASELFERDVGELAQQVAKNFHRLFGGIIGLAEDHTVDPRRSEPEGAIRRPFGQQ